MEAQLLFSDLFVIANGGKDISSKTASSERPEKYSVGICDYEHPCPTVLCLSVAYIEDDAKIQSKTEEKVDVVASFEKGWSNSPWETCGWGVGQRENLVQNG